MIWKRLIVNRALEHLDGDMQMVMGGMAAAAAGGMVGGEGGMEVGAEVVGEGALAGVGEGHMRVVRRNFKAASGHGRSRGKS